MNAQLESDTRLHGPWLAVGRLTWFVLTTLTLVVWTAALSIHFTNDLNWLPTPSEAGVLQQFGLPISFYAMHAIGLKALLMLVYLLPAIVIFWRRSDDWFTLIVSLAFVTGGAFSTWVLQDVDDTPSILLMLNRLVLLLGNAALFYLFYTFPDGRFVLRWTRPVFILGLLWIILSILFPDEPFSALGFTGLSMSLLLLTSGPAVAAQIYRYKFVSTAVQRQQTKWALFGFAASLGLVVVIGFLDLAFPELSDRNNSAGALISIFFSPLMWLIVYVILPLTIGIAVLRYRLWDIDIVINRTLVYGALTAGVVGLYGLIVGSASVVFRSGSNLISVLLATALVVAVFRPLRSRLQRGVDRLVPATADRPIDKEPPLSSEVGEQTVTLAVSAAVPQGARQETQMRAEHRSHRVHLALVPVASLLILLALSYLWLHLTTPFDNGRLQPGTKSINAEGLTLMPLESGPDGFRPGDLVTAVEGRSIEAWAQAALIGGASPPRWQVGDTARYTVIRNGAAQEIAVTLGDYPFGEIVSRNWGTMAFALSYLPIAAFVFLRRPDEPATRPLFLSSAALFCATTWSLGAQVGDFVYGAGLWLYHLSTSVGFMLVWIASFHFALVFPRPISWLARFRWLLPTIYALPYLLLVLYLIASRSGAVNTLDWMSRWGVAADVNATVFLSLTLVTIVRQYRANKAGVTRRQIRWLVLAALFVGGSALLFYFLPPLAGGKAVDSNVVGLIGVVFPVAIAIAILRHNLFDIDTLLNRTLVYGSLTAVIVSLYVLVVGVLGTVLQTSGNLFVALVATGLAAIVFQPLRERLQRGVNRMMYGERDEPFEVLSRLGQRLEANLSPDTTLKTIVESVAQALKLPYVAIALKSDDRRMTDDDGSPPISRLSSPDDVFDVVAAYGLPVEEPFRLPLVYRSETIGQLILAPRGRGESFTPAEQRLLESIAYQAGVAAYNVRLTADLQRSRERLVTTREEERRRLRRDLHDGLGPSLASLTLKLDAARNLLHRDPDQANVLLSELKTQTRDAIADIRRVAYDLRPPALDDLGLVSAIREQAESYSVNGLRVSVDVPDHIPVLPAAVEVAAYRIVMEALTNVARHARARVCCVRFSLDDALQVEIVDDGVGLAPHARAGVGLTSMRERAAELGGTFHVERAVSRGTRIVARLPLLKIAGDP